MNNYDMDQFCFDCESVNIILDKTQKEQFQRYYELLIEWNSFMNLTAITEYIEVLKKHFFDSLSIVKKIDLTEINNMIDIGTGAGFPGIPLKIAFPHLRVVLLDSLGKRVKFLNHVIEELKLEEIEAIHGRAEDFAKNVKYREQFDLSVSRAVANLASLSEYCIPYTKIGGSFVSYKSVKAEEEIHNAEKAISVLGGKVENICKFELLDTGERTLVQIKKIRKTDKKYPRKAGMPSREPIQ
ncbi:MAG: 16S rRNA (guanine(527)-N(7))-methyltransferase RsmG [Marvinbryantia sp.]|jgi:16S rRNA (guanine527-N7)-methyltransferase